MREEPAEKRAVAFFDAQNLYRHAKEAFGHHHPNFHPINLFDAVCVDNGWKNCGVRFYTGTPDFRHAEMWHGYWTNRLLTLRRAGVAVESRPIRYREHEITLEDGTIEIREVPQEKGIDLRLGLDAVRLARVNQLDVAVIFSQDQDLAEVVTELKELARDTDRWIRAVSAFPEGPRASTKRGINGADWYRMDEAFYNSYLDTHDYRPKKFQNSN